MEDSTALDYGVKVHDALAYAIGNVGGKTPNGSDARPLPAEFSELQPFVDDLRAARNNGAYVATELSLAINRDFSVCAWNDWDNVWYRAKADVVIMKGPVLIGKDWKTGKPLDDSPQLRMTAICLFAAYPEAQAIQSTFEWLKTDESSKEVMRRNQIPAVWNEIAPRVDALERAYKNPDLQEAFPPNPGALCKRYCPVTVCPFHGKGSY